MVYLICLIMLFFSSVFAQPSDIDPRYHTIDEVFTEVSAIADTYSTICCVETLGFSETDSIPIVAVKLSNYAHYDLDKSVVLIDGGQHANEPSGTETVMWMLHYLTSNYGSDADVTRWLDSLQLWFIPIVNMDGRQIVMNESSPHSLHWRKTTRDNNENGEFDFGIDGVDPNRNYDYKWEEYADTNWDSSNYKGPYPWSENCVAAVRDFVDKYRPTALLDLHSPDSTGGNKLWFCWWDEDIGTYHPEGFPHYYYVASELANNTETEVDGEHYEYRAAYNTKPKLQLWSYWFTSTCSIIMEITNQCFWTGDTVDTISARVGRGLFYIFDRMFEKGLIVRAYDGTHFPAQAEVIIDGVTDTTFPPRLCNFMGRYHRFLDGGTYTVRVIYDDEELVFDSVLVESGHNTYLTAEFADVEENEHNNNDLDVEFIHRGNYIVIDDFEGEFKLFNIIGKTVIEDNIGEEKLFSMENLPAGVYFARLLSKNGTIFKKRIVLLK